METIIRTPVISPLKRKLGARETVEPVRSQLPPMVEAQAPAVSQPQNPQSIGAGTDAARYVIPQQEIDDLRAKAVREGFAQGVEEGSQAARQSASEQLQRLASIAKGLSDARKEVLDEAENLAVEIVYTAVCRLIGESALTREGVAGAVAEATKGLAQENDLIVYLHPQDLGMIRGEETGEATLSILEHCQLRQDSTIKLGGCMIESANGMLDARLETQLVRLEETLLAVRRSRESQGGTR